MYNFKVKYISHGTVNFAVQKKHKSGAFIISRSNTFLTAQSILQCKKKTQIWDIYNFKVKYISFSLRH